MKKIGIKKKTKPQGLGIGMKISLDLISPIIVGILIGLGFDKIFSTKPIFLLLWLQWEAHVHVDLGFVMFDKLLATCFQARAINFEFDDTSREILMIFGI